MFPGGAYTKTGQLVMEVIREKHPAIHIPYLTDLEYSSFEEYNQDPDFVPLNISEGDVQ